MGTLISAADKADMEGAIVDIHDTFKRAITIYKKEKEIFVATNPVFKSSYNALYSKLKNAPQTRDTVSRTETFARIQYRQEQEQQDEAGLAAQLNVQFKIGELRIKLTKDAYTDFKFATKIEIDGIVWRIVTDASRSGLFSPQYYVLYLERDE